MTQSPATEMRKAIAAPIAQFMAAISHGDAAGAAAVYTADGQVLPPNGDIVSGRPAIQTLWQGAMDTGVQAVTLETIEVEGYGPVVLRCDQICFTIHEQFSR